MKNAEELAMIALEEKRKNELLERQAVALESIAGQLVNLTDWRFNRAAIRVVSND